MDANTAEWIRCPVCGSKTRDKMRKDTILKNFPLFCPKCKHENLINVIDLKMIVISEPAAKPQSR
ncbi:cysteine-rich KTR domain-containing protein [Emergencia sp. 1XD21-10]|uniref:cysteine-rich KTR domain-containing protein n=1 Tax=Emergencia sp. 1XD21-10 TaxID=2304569 RepID=UPI00137A71CE|nr:cysteine-rich KTR domain-containing protein [Emergencia sp. 1XD21-10]NCE97896.1 conjugal transfer protein [Emergencia sp. 1XD21-10]